MFPQLSSSTYGIMTDMEFDALRLIIGGLGLADGIQNHDILYPG